MIKDISWPRGHKQRKTEQTSCVHHRLSRVHVACYMSNYLYIVTRCHLLRPCRRVPPSSHRQWFTTRLQAFFLSLAIHLVDVLYLINLDVVCGTGNVDSEIPSCGISSMICAQSTHRHHLGHWHIDDQPHEPLRNRLLQDVLTNFHDFPTTRTLSETKYARIICRWGF